MVGSFVACGGGSDSKKEDTKPVVKPVEPVKPTEPPVKACVPAPGEKC